MAFTTHRGQRIHYTVDGSGDVLILQHGMFSNAAHWHERGFVAALSTDYMVVCVDSIAHGQSDIPTDPTCYAQQQRAGDIVAVMDALGAQKAHMLGYSMGGWIAVGMARYYPDRLASLTIGGWDALAGTDTVARVLGTPSLTFELLYASLQQVAPDMAKQVTPANQSAFQACYDELSDVAGAADALAALQVPVLLWNGTDDPYHQTMEPFAAQQGYEYLATPGDHMGAMTEHGVETAAAICGFLGNGRL